jgi:hypothetical protein
MQALFRSVMIAGLATLLPQAQSQMPAHGERPGEIPKPWTYEGSQKLNQPDPAPAPTPSYTPAAPQARGGSTGAAPAPDIARQWRAQPALAAARNRLLGRWQPQGSNPAELTAAARSNPLGNAFGAGEVAAQILGGMMTGACDQMFGRGVLEFRKDTLVSIEGNGQESVLNHLDYRGNDSRVAVLPREPGSVDVMLFDFKGPDRVTVAGFGCTMARMPSGANAAAATTATATPAKIVTTVPIESGGGARPATAGSRGGAMLALAAVLPSRSGRADPVIGTEFYLLNDSLDATLVRAGLPATPGVPPSLAWMQACEAQRTAACTQGSRAVQAAIVATARTGFSGTAAFDGQKPGTYYVYGGTSFQRRGVIWNVKVDLRNGPNELQLHQGNLVH